MSGFDREGFRRVAGIVEGIRSDFGHPQVDVILRTSGLHEGLVQSVVYDGDLVLLRFEDGEARIANLAEIAEVIVSEDRQKRGLGFSVTDESS